MSVIFYQRRSFSEEVSAKKGQRRRDSEEGTAKKRQRRRDSEEEAAKKLQTPPLPPPLEGRGWLRIELCGGQGDSYCTNLFFLFLFVFIGFFSGRFAVSTHMISDVTMSDSILTVRNFVQSLYTLLTDLCFS
jgi:hypothetical protein